MDDLEEENRELREEVSTLKESLERLNAVIESMAATQNQQRTVISEVVSAPISEVPVNSPRYNMPKGFPWGMPVNFMPEGYVPLTTEELRDVDGTSRLEGYKLQAHEDGRIPTDNSYLKRSGNNFCTTV